MVLVCPDGNLADARAITLHSALLFNAIDDTIVYETATDRLAT